MFVVVFLVGGGGTSLSLAGNSCHLTWVRHSSHKSSATHSYQCVQYFCVQTMVWLPMFGIFNTRTDVPACNCTQGLYGHRKRVCTESWLWQKNPLLHRGLEPASRLRLAFQSNALPTELSQPQLLCTVTLMGREGVGGGEACKIHKGKFWKSNPIKQMYKSVA